MEARTDSLEGMSKQPGIKLGKLILIKLNLAKDIKGNKKEFYGYIGDKGR